MADQGESKARKPFKPYRRKKKPSDTPPLSSHTESQPAHETGMESKLKSSNPLNRRGSRRGTNRPTAPLVEGSLGEKIRSEIRRGYECMICMTEIKFYQSVWSCKTCHKLFHMSCTHEVCNSSYSVISTSLLSGFGGTRRSPRVLQNHSSGDVRDVSMSTSNRTYPSTNVFVGGLRIPLHRDSRRSHVENHAQYQGLHARILAYSRVTQVLVHHAVYFY
jgi:hypothetical protein